MHTLPLNCLNELQRNEILQSTGDIAVTVIECRVESETGLRLWIPSLPLSLSRSSRLQGRVIPDIPARPKLFSTIPSGPQTYTSPPFADMLARPTEPNPTSATPDSLYTVQCHKQHTNKRAPSSVPIVQPQPPQPPHLNPSNRHRSRRILLFPYIKRVL